MKETVRLRVHSENRLNEKKVRLGNNLLISFPELFIKFISNEYPLD